MTNHPRGSPAEAPEWQEPLWRAVPGGRLVGGGAPGVPPMQVPACPSKPRGREGKENPGLWPPAPSLSQFGDTEDMLLEQMAEPEYE